MPHPANQHPAVPKRKAPKEPPLPFGDVSDAVLDLEIPIDDDWKKAVTDRLLEMRQGVTELAKHIGCSQGNVSQTLGDKRAQKQSAFAHAISLATGVELPTVAIAALVAHCAVQHNEAAYREIQRGLAHTYGV